MLILEGLLYAPLTSYISSLSRSGTLLPALFLNTAKNLSAWLLRDSAVNFSEARSKKIPAVIFGVAKKVTKTHSSQKTSIQV